MYKRDNDPTIKRDRIGMEIEVLGIGNAFTSIHYQTSFLLRAGRTYLIDGPQGLFQLLHARGIAKEEINDVIVTHIHGDHVAGLETLFVWKRHFEKKRVRIHTSKSVFGELKSRFFPSFSEGFGPDHREIRTKQFEDYIEFFELQEDRVNELEKGLTIEIRHNWHPVSTLGLKIAYRGRKIAVSGDTCYRPVLLQELHAAGVLSDERYYRLTGDWLWDADVIYHEADDTPDGPHTYLGDLLKLPSQTQKRIRLVHIPDELVSARIPVARQGERFLVRATGELVGPLTVRS